MARGIFFGKKVLQKITIDPKQTQTASTFDAFGKIVKRQIFDPETKTPLEEYFEEGIQNHWKAGSMFKPNFKLILDKDFFCPDKVVCLGSQMISIINFLKHILEPHTWYGADIDAFGKGVKKFTLDPKYIKKIGTDASLIKICSEIDQFLSGLFFAIQNKYSVQKSIALNISTEDEPFRPLNIEGILIEIRTFDTSYFEFFSEDEIIIKKLSNKFKSEYSLKNDIQP